MEKQISTYTPDEAEAIKKLDEFQIQLTNQLQQGENISKVEYYNKLKVGETIEINSDFYLATIKGEAGERTGIYAQNSNNLMGYVDDQGNVEFVDGFLSHLNISLTIEDLRDINIENLKAKVEELQPEELEEYLQEQKEEKSDIGESSREKVKEDGEEKEKNQVEEALQEEMGKDLEISYYREIKDNQMQKEFPDKFRGASQIGMAYSKTMNRFILVKKEGDQFERVEGIDTSKPTLRTIISINEDGDKIERKCPHALMKTDNDKKELSVTIGQYGYIETGIVDRLPCNERIEHQVREDGQGEEGRTDVELRKTLNREGTEVPHELAHNFQENEEKLGIETQNLEAIDGDKEIKLQDGTITTLGEEAMKDKVSVEEFIRIFKQAEGISIDEKLDNTHAEIERQAGAPSLTRNEK